MQTVKEKSEGRTALGDSRGVKVVRSININRSTEDLFRFWRRLENLPQFMKHVVSVTQTSAKESHWVAKGPANRTLKWDALIINEHENSLIAWRSKQGSTFENAGSVRFEPGRTGLGTEVTLTMEYVPPAGKLGFFLARLSGLEPGRELEEALSQFKSLMETRPGPSEKK